MCCLAEAVTVNGLPIAIPFLVISFFSFFLLFW